MNNLIKQQLQQCKIAQIPEFEDNDVVLNIKKLNSLTLLEKHYYLIQIEQYIINQPPNFTLSENWNNCTKPPELLLNIEVLQIMGNMIKVNAVGYNSHISWEGWLPLKSIKVLQQL